NVWGTVAFKEFEIRLAKENQQRHGDASSVKKTRRRHCLSVA
ncbi:MAG: hypothetical protein RIT00_1032, partial [Actinomycetota bacterium]